MGLLKSVENVPGIDFYEYRDQDYYGKYTYRARFSLLGIRHLLFVNTIEELNKCVDGKPGYYDKA